MKKILLALTGLLFAASLHAQEKGIASKYSLYTGEVDTVDYTAGKMAVYIGLGLGSGDYKEDNNSFAGNSGKFKLTDNTLGYGFNWAPTDNFYLSVSSLSTTVNATGKNDVADGGTYEWKKNLTGLGYIQLQLAAKTDFLGGGLKLRSNSSVSEFKWELIGTDGEATNSSQKAKANYTDYELYINMQFHPMISAGLAYSPAVSAKDTFEVTPSPTSASYHLAGHGTQTKLHALLAPIDILGIRLDYNKEAENKSSNDAAETETKLSGYVILGPGILGIDYSSVKKDEYILSEADAVDGKASQKEYTATTTGIEYQMAATENIHLDFRYDSYKKDTKKLSTSTSNGAVKINAGTLYFTFAYAF